MKRREISAEVIYWIVVLVVWYLSTSDAPLTVEFWYRLSRAAQTVARWVGRVGLHAERKYHLELEKTRTI